MTEDEFGPKQWATTITLSDKFKEPRKIPRKGFIELIRVKLLRMKPRFITLPSDYETIKNGQEKAQKAMQEMIDKPLYKLLGGSVER